MSGIRRNREPVFLIIKIMRKFPENRRICIDERQCSRALQTVRAKKGSNKNNDMPMMEGCRIGSWWSEAAT